MKTQHTPGPWKAIDYTNAGQFVTEKKIVSSDSSVLARLGPCNIDANAKLIAAAPDLLEACLKASQAEAVSLNPNLDLWKLINEAISKATI